MHLGVCICFGIRNLQSLYVYVSKVCLSHGPCPQCRVLLRNSACALQCLAALYHSCQVASCESVDYRCCLVSYESTAWRLHDPNSDFPKRLLIMRLIDYA